MKKGRRQLNWPSSPMAHAEAAAHAAASLASAHTGSPRVRLRLCKRVIVLHDYHTMTPRTITTETNFAPSTPKNVTFANTKPPLCLGAATQLRPAQHTYDGL